MAQKIINIDGIGEVLFVKRRGAKSIRLSITADNAIRASMPPWVPYQAAISFVGTRKDWIDTHRQVKNIFRDGDLIGKSHRLKFIETDVDAIRTRVNSTEIRVTIGKNHDYQSKTVQDAVKKAAMRAIKQEGEALLPRRLRELAIKYNFEFKSVELKRLKARWGSCSHKKEITLNIFLMQLPWHLIDYVLVHELVHTKVLHHGPDFWKEFSRCLPDAKSRRKELKGFSPYF